MTYNESRTNLTHNLVLPTLLFAALGGMTWAVRGCAGFGATPGCIFAGVMWGAAWWYIARDPAREQSRRYASGWIVLALTIGIGLAGSRGWMQWPNFFEGRFETSKDVYLPIDRVYGFIWMFIAGVPWAGLGACLLAWCGSRETRIWHWVLRLGCGAGGWVLARYLLDMYPQYILPLYDRLESQYADLDSHGNLKRLVNDTRVALEHLGVYLGFLLYEILRRDWKNVVLIFTVGVVNGVGWAGCQNWKWADDIWPTASFNWWRCWESSGGISIGIAYGIAYFLVNRPMSSEERALVQTRKVSPGASFEWLLIFLGLAALLGAFAAFRLGHWGKADFGIIIAFAAVYYLLNRGNSVPAPGQHSSAPTRDDPNLERFGLYVGLLVGVGLSVRNGLKGWFRIYKGEEAEPYWDALLWQIASPTIFALLTAIVAYILFTRLSRDHRGDVFPHACGWMWLVLIVHNIIAQFVTGPPTEWNEMAFSIYYVLLFAITAVIVVHYRWEKESMKAEG